MLIATGAFTTVCMTLTLSSLINMYQMSSLLSKNSKNVAPLSNNYNKKPEFHSLDDLKKMSRNESITVFLDCDVPLVEDLEGEWEGFLLNNNGFVMVRFL